MQFKQTNDLGEEVGDHLGVFFPVSDVISSSCPLQSIKVSTTLFANTSFLQIWLMYFVNYLRIYYLFGNIIFAYDEISYLCMNQHIPNICWCLYAYIVRRIPCKNHTRISLMPFWIFFKSNFVAWSATPTKLLLKGEIRWKIKELFVRVNAIGVQHFVGNLPSDLVWFCYLLSGLCLEEGKNITRFRSESSYVLGVFFVGCFLFLLFVVVLK